ncbi:MAG: hypothetical protein R2861_03730 [Desulfobacterales bacterium]
MPHTSSLKSRGHHVFKNSMDYYMPIPKVLVRDTASDAVLAYVLMPGHSIRQAVEALALPGITAHVSSPHVY